MAMPLAPAAAEAMPAIKGTSCLATPGGAGVGPGGAGVGPRLLRLLLVAGLGLLSALLLQSFSPDLAWMSNDTPLHDFFSQQ